MPGEYAGGMTDRYPVGDKQIYGADVDDDDMDAILNSMNNLDAVEGKEDKLSETP